MNKFCGCLVDRHKNFLRCILWSTLHFQFNYSGWKLFMALATKFYIQLILSNSSLYQRLLYCSSTEYQHGGKETTFFFWNPVYGKISSRCSSCRMFWLFRVSCWHFHTVLFFRQIPTCVKRSQYFFVLYLLFSFFFFSLVFSFLFFFPSFSSPFEVSSCCDSGVK